MKAFQSLRLAMQCLARLESMGFKIEIFNDFEKVSEFITSVGKRGVTPKMDPAHNDFFQDTCTWFSLVENGKPVAAMGAKLDELGSESVSQFLSRSTSRQYGQGTIANVAPAEALGLSGKLAYVGELFVSKDRRGGRAVVRLFVLFVISMSAAEWRVDHVYAFFRERDVLAKMPQLYGFSDLVPGVMTWNGDVEGRASSEWMASISRPRINHLSALCDRDEYWLTLQSIGSE